MRRYDNGKHDRITYDPPDYPDDSIDEIVLSGVDVHLERMDKDRYYLGISAGPRCESLLAQVSIGRRGKDVVASVYHLGGDDVDRIPENEVGRA